MVTLFLNGQQQQQHNLTQQKQISRGYLISKWSTTTTNNTWLPYF